MGYISKSPLNPMLQGFGPLPLNWSMSFLKLSSEHHNTVISGRLKMTRQFIAWNLCIKKIPL